MLDALRAAGAEVHALCSDERFLPAGSCRTCMVGVAGREHPAAACTTPVAEGMEVHSDDPVAQAAVTTLELFVSELPARAPSCPRSAAS